MIKSQNPPFPTTTNAQSDPVIIGIATGRTDAYEYLGGSIEKFPSGRAMTELIESCGFRGAMAKPLTLGTVSIYTAKKV
jgi:demethylmenaquinone methyltransferase/2-methoxy-6-polyprenyl-1,4-benzoquinol methylase